MKLTASLQTKPLYALIPEDIPRRLGNLLLSLTFFNKNNHDKTLKRSGCRHWRFVCWWARTALPDFRWNRQLNETWRRLKASRSKLWDLGEIKCNYNVPCVCRRLLKYYRSRRYQQKSLSRPSKYHKKAWTTMISNWTETDSTWDHDEKSHLNPGWKQKQSINSNFESCIFYRLCFWMVELQNVWQERYFRKA